MRTVKKILWSPLFRFFAFLLLALVCSGALFTFWSKLSLLEVLTTVLEGVHGNIDRVISVDFAFSLAELIFSAAIGLLVVYGVMFAFLTTCR